MLGDGEERSVFHLPGTERERERRRGRQIDSIETGNQRKAGTTAEFID